MQTKSISCLSIGADGRSAKSVRTSQQSSGPFARAQLSPLGRAPIRPDATYRTANRRTPLRSMR